MWWCWWWWETKWGIYKKREEQVIGQVKQSPASTLTDEKWISFFPDCGRDEKAYTHARRLPPGREMKESNWKEKKERGEQLQHA
jgi:hypothetical protein